MTYTFNTIRGNSIYKKNFIKDIEEFTKEEQEVLLDGGEIPVEWDENDEPIEWCSIYEEE